MMPADERMAEIKAKAIAQAKRNIESGRGTVIKIDASDIAYPDSVAILSVWGQVKDGGTWAAPGPPPWVVNKIASDRGTLVMGVLDERTSAAFSAAGITISEPAGDSSTAHALLDKVAGVMGVEVAGALREFLYSQEMAMTRLADEVEGLKVEVGRQIEKGAGYIRDGGKDADDLQAEVERLKADCTAMSVERQDLLAEVERLKAENERFAEAVECNRIVAAIRAEIKT